MDDPTPMDIDPQPAPPVTYEIVEEVSKRRCKKLIDSIGYSYTFKEKQKRPITGSAPSDWKETHVEPLLKSKIGHSSRGATLTTTSQNLEPSLQQRL